MDAAVVRAAVAPVLSDATVRAEQVTQLLLGETVALLEQTGEWRRVQAHRDGYEGWVHEGYLHETDTGTAAEWRARATGWCEGACFSCNGVARPAPLGARLAFDQGCVVLPDGRRAQVVDGRVRPAPEVVAVARQMPVERWALERFAGSPYQWGGRTPWGVDCSGLVQAAFAARGLDLPRDSSQQARCGVDVSPDAIQPGDLLFFRSETGSAITHVAFAAEGDTLIHATIACGGVVHEPWHPGTRAARLRERLVAVRRVGGRS